MAEARISPEALKPVVHFHTKDGPKVKDLSDILPPSEPNCFSQP